MSKITAKEIAEEIIKIIAGEEKIKIQKKLTPFQKTEKLLYNLKYFKGAVDVKRKRLLGLQNDPALLSKKEIGLNVQGSKKFLPEIEKLENLIEEVKTEIERLENVIEMTETALKEIEDDKYYKVIEIKYFEEMTLEYIAEQLNIGEMTVKRNKNRLIKNLQMMIFSNNVMADILKD